MSTKRATIKRGVEALLAALLAVLFTWIARMDHPAAIAFQWYLVWMLIDTRLSRSTEK